MRRILIFALLVLLCLGALCLPAAAETAEIDLARDIDPAQSRFGLVELYSDRNRWEDETGAAMRRTAAVYEGSTLFGVPVYTISTGTARVRFDPPCNLDSFHTLGLVCMVEAPEAVTAAGSITITLTAGDRTLSAEAAVPPNVWCEIAFDIGSWVPRCEISRIEISFSPPSRGAALQFSHLRANPEITEAQRIRFMTDAFSIRGGTIDMAADGESALIIPTESSPIVEANLLPPTLSIETNAIRLIFENHSACERLTLQYAYQPDGANARAITTTVGAGRQTCLFELPNASAVRYVRLIFTGANSGEIILHALSAVSVYDSGIESLGELTDCLLDRNSRQIVIRGTLAHDVMIANRENELVLLPVYPWETAETALTDGRAPIAAAAISIRFEFRLNADDTAYALASSYLVALHDNSGDTPYTPIASPVSLDLAPTQTAVQAFKGVQTGQISSAVQAGASLHLLDVYLDRLCHNGTSGYLYPHNGSCYYFNREELAALDREISLRSTTGAAVYLRFLISPDETDVSYAIPFDHRMNGATRGILIADRAACDQITAITEFLCTRYNGSTDAHGSIAGIVVGKQVNAAVNYNEIGVHSLSAYVDRYADLLTLIANVGRAKLPGLKVIVPVSDRRAAVCITPDMLENSFDTELFLRSLFGRLDDRGGLSVSLMLESEHNPFALTEGMQSASGSGLSPSPEDGSQPAITPSLPAEPAPPLAVTTVESDYYTADRLEDFTTLLDTLSADYRSMPATFICCWTPEYNTGDMLSTVYSYLYYRLRFDAHAEAFIVSFALAESFDEMGGMPGLRHLMKYIDTARSLDVTEHALEVLAAAEWSELVIGFSADALAARAYREGELSGSATSPAGRWEYWHFSSAYSTQGWAAGTHISGIAVKGSGDDRALIADIDRTGAETGAYSEIICHFIPTEPIDVLDRIRFNLMIEGDGVWEICIVSGSPTACVEQKQVVEAGVRTELCFSIGEGDSLDAEYLKIAVKPVSGSGEGRICLFSVVGESDTMSDHALSAKLSDRRGNALVIVPDAKPPIGLAWIFAICAVVIFSITIVILLGRRPSTEEHAAKK